MIGVSIKLRLIAKKEFTHNEKEFKIYLLSNCLFFDE